MEKKLVEVYCGNGKGKSMAAIGCAVHAVGQGESVIMIQFLKGNKKPELNILEGIKQEIKVFCFEKYEDYYQDLPYEKQQEEVMNIKNGFNFARKVLVTEECDFLVLDEILGVVDLGIISTEDFTALIQSKDEHTQLILTGQCISDEIADKVDVITRLDTITNS